MSAYNLNYTKLVLYGAETPKIRKLYCYYMRILQTPAFDSIKIHTGVCTALSAYMQDLRTPLLMTHQALGDHISFMKP